MALLNQSQYARLKKISRQAVSRAIKEGRIVLTDGKIDTEGGRSSSGALPTYGESKAARAAFEARLKRIEYEEKRGEVVNAAEVARAWNDLAGRVRDEMLAIPDRVALKLESRNAREIREILMTETRRALLVMADEVITV